MNKKQYCTPHADVINIKANQNLLAGSLPVNSGETNAQLARQFGLGGVNLDAAFDLLDSQDED